jgi:cytochrome c biogenesis protein CcmG, thiol:disulfide interchange protein DsbE
VGVLPDNILNPVGCSALNKKTTHIVPNQRNPYAMLLVGAGLLLLGIVVALWLAWPDAGSTRANGASLSVVPVKVEYQAPELVLSDLDGQPVSLEDLRGSIVLVNNWATWCPPCKAEMPTLQAYYSQYQDQGFVLVAINAGDPAQDVQDFVREYKLTFPVWLDPQNAALQAFKNDALPSSYVIDRQGMIRLAWTGAISQAMLEKYVTPLLEE